MSASVKFIEDKLRMMTAELFYIIFFGLCAWQSLVIEAKYQLKTVVLPDNLDNVRIFTDDDLVKFDGTNVNIRLTLSDSLSLNLLKQLAVRYVNLMNNCIFNTSKPFYVKNRSNFKIFNITGLFARASQPSGTISLDKLILFTAS